MSRAMNVDAALAEVEAVCGKHAVVISAIETLPSGRTRVVLATGDGAAIVRRVLAKKIVTEVEGRTPLAPTGGHSRFAVSAPRAPETARS